MEIYSSFFHFELIVLQYLKMHFFQGVMVLFFHLNLHSSVNSLASNVQLECDNRYDQRIGRDNSLLFCCVQVIKCICYMEVCHHHPNLTDCSGKPFIELKHLLCGRAYHFNCKDVIEAFPDQCKHLPSDILVNDNGDNGSDTSQKSGCTMSPNNEASKTSTTAVVAIVLAVLFLLALTVLVIWWFFLRRHRTPKSTKKVKRDSSHSPSHLFQKGGDPHSVRSKKHSATKQHMDQRREQHEQPRVGNCHQIQNRTSSDQELKKVRRGTWKSSNHLPKVAKGSNTSFDSRAVKTRYLFGRQNSSNQDIRPEHESSNIRKMLA